MHWDYHPAPKAFCPPEREPGQEHIFSGGAFLNRDGTPTIIYHGVGKGTCIAVPEDDGLIEWRNLPQNPVIPEPKRPGDPGWGIYNVFDPHAWVEGDEYRAILGGKVKPHNRYDTAYLFRSPDLVNWEYLGPFYAPDPRWTDASEDCACPDFFPIGNRWMLACISHPLGARYYLGRYENGRFVPEEHHRMNWPGGSCFATESLLDDKGRRISWAWVPDQRPLPEEEPPLGTWADDASDPAMADGFGVFTLPRVLSLDERGQLRIDPPRELESLRQNPRECPAVTLAAGAERKLAEIAGDTIELALEATVMKPAVFGLRVRMAPDRAEQTVIRVDTGQGTLAIDTSRSSLNPHVFQKHPVVGDVSPNDDAPRQVPGDVRVQAAPFVLEAGERLQLRVFVDRSILEVYANRRQCVTQRIYPTRSDSQGTAVFCRGQNATVHCIRAWNMNTCRP